jgi:hypothetical protein
MWAFGFVHVGSTLNALSVADGGLACASSSATRWRRHAQAALQAALQQS